MTANVTLARLAAYAALLLLTACGGNGISIPAQNGGTPVSAAAYYTAIGASDAVGYGASVPCANPPLIANPTCPGGTGYVPVLRNLLAANGTTVNLNDLGISGAVLGPDIQALGNMYGSIGSPDACMPRGSSDSIPGNFISNELPHLTGLETLITVFAGGNDTNVIVNALGCGAGGGTLQSQTAFITQQIQNFGNDLLGALSTVRSRAPKAKIVIANLPNFALIPIGQAQSQLVRQALAAVSVGIDQHVINQATTLGVPVVDLLCDPRSYDPANFSPDGFHPDDAGYAVFAQVFLAQITAATPAPPQASCSFATQASRLRHVLRQPIPAFERGH